MAKNRLRFSAICRVEMEEASLSTWENFLLTKELLIARGQSPACVAVVSNRYHLARCKAIADAVGIPVVLCAAEDRMDASMESLVLLTREAFYLMAMNAKILAWHITRFPRA